MTQRFLLKSLWIEDFKAVRRSGTNGLTPLTTFIGVNGSGKVRRSNRRPMGSKT